MPSQVFITNWSSKLQEARKISSIRW